MTIPSSDFIAPESDGSLGVIVKNGLYVWKVYKKFPFADNVGTNDNIWVPIRAERQEINFVSNRVNACNQCHQDRNQDNIDLYKDYSSIAQHKMKGDVSSMAGTDKDISDYNATEKIPDFHKDVVPLLTKAGLNGGASCVDCHNATDKLNWQTQQG